MGGPVSQSQSQSREEEEEVYESPSRTEAEHPVTNSISSGSVDVVEEESNNQLASAYPHLQPPPSLIDSSIKNIFKSHSPPSSSDNNSQLMDLQVRPLYLSPGIFLCQ